MWLFLSRRRSRASGTHNVSAVGHADQDRGMFRSRAACTGAGARRSGRRDRGRGRREVNRFAVCPSRRCSRAWIVDVGSAAS